MRSRLESYTAGHLAALESLKNQYAVIESICLSISRAIERGNTLYICGNGGSAADAQHMAAEFTIRYKMERRALPALALSTDTSAITACGNDYSFDAIFSRQLEAFAKGGDVLLGISTSGNSPNVIKAIEAAKKMGVTTIAFLGKDGGKIKGLVDHALVIASNDTPRIQEMHSLAMHAVCEIVEQEVCK
jgi:D-sedoheptulose 7-phosphate isomerase